MTKEKDGVEIKIQPDGAKHWYFHGVLHRDDGPAVERPHGEKWWFQFGKQHREDGPAVEYDDGRTNEYWLNGEKWEDVASIIARRKAEKARPKKPPRCPRPFKLP